MNPMNDERFFDLAMKVIARHATDAERAELDAFLARDPELRAEFERLQADAQVAKDALPLVDATQATAGEFPAYARGSLQTRVRQTLGRPAVEKEPNRALAWRWRWVLGLTAATAVVVFVLIPTLRPQPETVVQVAVLDTAGATRGADTNEVQLLQQNWTDVAVDVFSASQSLRAWETKWPAAGRADVVKVVYDRAAGEIRVSGKRGGRDFSKTFPVEDNLATTLKLAKEYISEETKR
jgi:hypothetical protein